MKKKDSNYPHFVKDISPEPYSTLNMASPFKDVSCAFNWLNTDYPFSHIHAHWEIHVAMSGTILHKINGEEHIVNRGDVYLIRPHDKHSLHAIAETDETYQHINFVVDTEFAKKLLSLYSDYDELLNKKNFVRFSLNDSDLIYLRERALLTQNLSCEEYVENTKLIITYIVIKYFEQRMLFNSEYPAWLNSFIVYISSPTSFGLTVQELAKYTSYSYSRLARIFKTYTGETIVNFVNSKKMNYAKRLLRSTNLSTVQISNQIGYTSLSSFNHLFKSTFGITPSAYRKQRM